MNDPAATYMTDWIPDMRPDNVGGLIVYASWPDAFPWKRECQRSACSWAQISCEEAVKNRIPERMRNMKCAREATARETLIDFVERKRANRVKYERRRK